MSKKGKCGNLDIQFLNGSILKHGCSFVNVAKIEAVQKGKSNLHNIIENLCKEKHSLVIELTSSECKSNKLTKNIISEQVNEIEKCIEEKEVQLHMLVFMPQCRIHTPDLF